MNVFHNPPEEEIKKLLTRVRTIAVIGLSPKPTRPSHVVAAHLRGFGYRIIPVRPATTEVLGEKAYASLRDVPGTVDMVEVFRAPEHVDAIVDACIACKIPVLWLQDGVVNVPAALRAQAAGMTVIMDRCAYRDHVSFFGRAPQE